jgi:glucose-6-phosphate 1-dehydrogenase
MNSPFVIIIFGATGDLAKRKLFPALYSLYKSKKIGKEFYIVGFSRTAYSDSDFRHFLGDELEFHHDKEWKGFAKNIYYQQGVFDQIDGYTALIDKLNSFDAELGACITRLFYLATPVSFYETIIRYLKSTKLSEGCGQGSEKWTRLAIEKPFGKNLEDAKALDVLIADIFEEKQIYRVDHYLAKETVQNMISFRFANGIFEPVWNNKYIDHVQITWSEKKGIGMRGKFFDGTGMLRDVAQNHLLQLLATVAMEQPKSFTKESVRDERARAIKAIRHIKSDTVSQNIVRGQAVQYLKEKNVAPDSETETFVAMKLFVDTERFKGIPFFLRAGKYMPEDVVDIKIVFVQTCQLLFKEYGCPEIGNVLTIRIQPDEGIGLRVIAKKPGSELALDTVDMKFSYQQTFGGHGGEAYEKILQDILHGDQMLFNRSDELESSWGLISSILHGWNKKSAKLYTYEKSTWGPEEANTLIEKEGRNWL